MFAAFALAALALAHPAQAQEDAEPAVEPSGYHNVDLVDRGRHRMPELRDYRNVLVLSPMILPLGMKATLHHMVGERTSVITGAGLGLMAADGEGLSRVDVRLGLNHHPIGNGLHGFYVGPRASGTWMEMDGDAVALVHLGAAAGYRWIRDPGLSVALGFGGRYSAILAGDGGDVALTTPTVEFNVGWAF